ncbi:MAG: YciI family protein [Stenotrophobium sp.]
MRFMLLVIPKDYAHAKPGAMPDAKVVEAMSKYNNELMRAGVLLGMDGLHPLSTGARVSFAGGKASVTDGPFVETKEVLGGYWMIKVGSREEAIAWVKRAPMPDGEIIEIRQVQEFEDFTPEVQKAAGNEPALQAELRKRKKS